MKSLWQRAKDENLKVEEKATGIQADVIEIGGQLYLDEGLNTVSPVTEFTEDDFCIVNDKPPI